MEWYIITKNRQPTKHQTPNELFILIALEYLKEAYPNDAWDYIIEERK